MIVYNINIDMSSPHLPEEIPFEDEVSPGPSRQNIVNNNTDNENNGNKDGSDRSDGNDGGPPNRRSKKRRRGKTSASEPEGPSDSSASDTVKRLERTVRAMNNKLKKWSTVRSGAKNGLPVRRG
jgi:hypothetical protein